MSEERSRPASAGCVPDDCAAASFTPLNKYHLKELMPIEEEAYEEPWNEGMFREEIRSPRSHVDVLIVNETIAGYGGLWFVFDETHITTVVVREGFRGRGYGRIIMNHLLRKAEGLGAHLVTLEVRKSNTVAHGLYRSLGFRPVGEHKRYYTRTGEDATIMALEFNETP